MTVVLDDPGPLELGDVTARRRPESNRGARESADVRRVLLLRGAATQTGRSNGWNAPTRATGPHDIKSDPMLRKLRGDPRYAAFLKKMNMPVTDVMPRRSCSSAVCVFDLESRSGLHFLDKIWTKPMGDGERSLTERTAIPGKNYEIMPPPGSRTSVRSAMGKTKAPSANHRWGLWN